MSEASEIESVARRVIQRLAVPFCHNGLVCSLSASIGIARSPEDATTVASLLECADAALYAAKRGGRGRFHYYRDCTSNRCEVAVSAPAPSARVNRFAVIESLHLVAAKTHDNPTDFAARHRKALAAIKHSRALLAQTRLAIGSTLCQFSRPANEND